MQSCPPRDPGSRSFRGAWHKTMLVDIAKEVSAAFVEFDAGCKGYLTRHELRCVYVSLLGHPPPLVRRAANSLRPEHHRQTD